MISRYSLPEMAAIWSEPRRLAAWTEVEVAVMTAWAGLGVVPPSAAEAAAAAPVPTPEAVAERESLTGHDLAAFVDVLAGSVTIGGEWVHYGLTSSDVLDTAGAVLMRDAADLLLTRLDDLFEVVRRRALDHRASFMIGRTHGIWAEPTSFGVKLATWAFELDRNRERLIAARQAVAVGKISGAVGTYAHCPPEVEETVCAGLGLGVEPAASQVTPRDRHAQLLQTVALLGASLERFATEIRHLQRSEVAEVREPFGATQKGSSAMPHKRNPILSERITGLARVLRGYAQTGLENVALWHERDISHSAAERIILPDACLAIDYMLDTFTRLVEGLVVDTGRMRSNLEATRGVVFSQAVLLALIETGLTRDTAYRLVQHHALTAADTGSDLADLLAADHQIPLPAERLAECFDPERFLLNADVIFDRLRRLNPARPTQPDTLPPVSG